MTKSLRFATYLVKTSTQKKSHIKKKNKFRFDGEDQIIPIAKKILDASFLEHEFLPPKVHFYFYAGVPSKISSILTRLGVTVHGEIQDFPEFEIDDETESEDEDFGKYTAKQASEIVNLDTCTMITMVSNLSNDMELKKYIKGVIFDLKMTSDFG